MNPREVRKEDFVFLQGQIFIVGILLPSQDPGWEESKIVSFQVFPFLFSWWYNWHVTPNHEMDPPEDHCTCTDGSCGPAPQGKSFIPMVWGYHEEDRPWHDDINDIDDGNIIECCAHFATSL